MDDDSPSRAPSSHLFVLFRFRSRPDRTTFDDNDRISLPSHMRAQILDPGCPFWKSFLVPCSNGARRKIFTSSFRGYYYQRTNDYGFGSVSLQSTTLCLSRGGVLCTFGPFSTVALRLTAPPICQFRCIPTPHSLGSAIGCPGRLVTHVPSLPPAKQHHARHAEGES